MTILAPPWAVRRKFPEDFPVTIATETAVGPDAPMMNAFAFGFVATEVRPVYLAAYRVGGGEVNDLTSA